MVLYGLRLVGTIAMTSLETGVIHLAHRAPGPWAFEVSESAGSLALVFVAVLLIGSTGWQDVKRAMRWCRPWYLALGAALAFAVSAFVSVGQYVFDRVDWVAHSFGMTAAPQFAAYFSVPGAAQLLLFALRFPKRLFSADYFSPA